MTIKLNMTIKHPRIVLPNHLYDEFPTDQEAEHADSLLASWTSLWHPAVLKQAESVPNWTRIDDLNASLDGFLLVVPLITSEEIDERLRTRIAEQSAMLIENTPDRDIILESIQAQNDPESSVFRDVDPDLLADFFALGYCYLQIELLTKHMRYSSGVSESSFAECLKDAANEALSNADPELVREKLTNCFDILTQEREHYYAVDVFLIDIALLHEQLDSNLISKQIESNHPFNFVASVKTAESILCDETSAPSIEVRIKKGEIGMLTGEYVELPNSLLGLESILANFQKGVGRFTTTFGRTPSIYGRRAFGLSPALPQILSKLGFKGALHATFDDGQFPETSQTKSRWEGNDGTGIDAIMRTPLDATKSSTFLKLASSISDSMDMDHVATKGFVHWAGQTSPWFEELRRTANYTTALGRFVTVDSYFDQTYDPGMHDCFSVSRYRSPYLSQAVQQKRSDPISSSVRYCRRSVRLQQLSGLNLLANMLGVESKDSNAQLKSLRVDLLDRQQDHLLDEKIKTQHQTLLESVRGKLLPTGSTMGLMHVNTFSFPLRNYFAVDAAGVEMEKPVYAFEPGRSMISDTSGMGFAWLPFKSSATSAKSNRPRLVEDNLLRNEFLEAVVDPKSGGIRFVRDFKNRGNRLSLQIAMRISDKVAENDETYASCYTKMIASEVVTKTNSSTLGEIEVKGQLVDHADEPVANFSQIIRLELGSRVLQISVEVDPIRLPDRNPWHSYYCFRSAWPNEATDLYVSSNDTRQPMTARRFEAPFFFDLDDAVSRTTFLAGGLPYHRRVGTRMLDTLFLVDGETERRFRVGIGIDLRNPFREAHRMHELTASHVTTGSANKTNGWLIHIDATNVIATNWIPLIEKDAVAGFTVRLIETEGKTTKVKLSVFREIESVRKVDYVGDTIDHCENGLSDVKFAMHGYEWAQLEIRFKED